MTHAKQHAIQQSFQSHKQYCTLHKCKKNTKNVDARNIAAGMSNHKNQQDLTVNLKHSDGKWV